MSVKDEKNSKRKTLVVGLGASAGGLSPLKDFLKSLPENPGMAFIIVLHLSPDRKSQLAELFKRETALTVQQVKERINIETNHIYVIPPGKMLSVEDNHLELSEPEEAHGSHTIDLLFRTLGKKKKRYSAGIIFSGTGSDGVTGMRIIKEQGGITIAQDPEEAQHSSMPQNSINTGVVDKVLPVKDIADELVQYRETLQYIRIAEDSEELSKKEKTEKVVSKILDRIHSRISHDFSNYRRPSLLRRIDRRMRINRVRTLKEYLEFIEKNPAEIDELYKDLLISVTNFFRDSEAFNLLEEKIIPNLFEGKENGEQIRIWVPGCATGEEAYSIAILLQEYISGMESSTPEIQIFASDVDTDAIEQARAGRYPKSIENDVSKERLRRFFNENNQSYVVKELLRDQILFASHDLLRNPPFSKLDLISCRNLLIYLNRDLQSEIFNLFHYALAPGKWLFLGKSDSSLTMDKLFTSVSQEYRIYQKNDNQHKRTSLPHLPLLYKATPVSNYKENSVGHKNNLEKMHWRLLARLYAPESVLITQDFEVVHSTEGIKKYLEYGGGKPSQNILDMVKPEIRQGLRRMLFPLKNKESDSAQKKIQITIDHQSRMLEITARQFSDKEFPDGLIHLVFKEIPGESEKSTHTKKSDDVSKTDDEMDLIESLENELEYNKEQLQLSVEEYETSNEELRASNEELQSMNEELQSTTEELETSQEELQSVNEELKTVNDQLEAKVDELSRAHSDLENLMEATEVGVIFVDKDMCVQQYTSTATQVFNLIESDKGRPLAHITHSLDDGDLLKNIKEVLENLENIKKVVSTKNGHWYIMRMRPYRSTEDKIEGVVISFTEFTELKEARDVIKEQNFQETLATLGVYALEKDDLSMIMHRAIQQSCAILDLQCAAILILSDDKKTFNVASEAQCGCADAGLEIENNEKWDLGYTLKSKKPVSIIDFNEEKRFKISPCMEPGKFTSSAQIAIRGTDISFGVFVVYSTETREFSKQDLHFLQVVANILGRSIEQQRAKKRVKKTNDRLKKEMKRSKELQKDILNSNVLERWELGGYLHDNFGQLLASIKILVDDIRIKNEKNDTNISVETNQINEIVDRCISDIRDVIHDIIPVDIEKEGVTQAFRLLMNQTYKLYGMKCILERNDILNEIKNRNAATHLYHIVQEAFKNSAQHGNAETVTVSIDKKDEFFILKIKDDGTGLKFPDKADGRGVRIIEHRMELMGGTFNIKNYSDEDQSGTLVTCILPMKKLKKKESSQND